MRRTEETTGPGGLSRTLGVPGRATLATIGGAGLTTGSNAISGSCASLAAELTAC